MKNLILLVRITETCYFEHVTVHPRSLFMPATKAASILLRRNLKTEVN